MEKRTILAIVLSIIVYLVWMQFFIKKPAQPPKSATETTQTAHKDDVAAPTAKANGPHLKDASRLMLTPSKKLSEKSLQLVTDHYQIRLSNRGARIESLQYGERKLELVAGREALNVKGYFDFPLHFNAAQFQKGSSLEDSLWEMKQVADNKVVFSIDARVQDVPVVIEKIFTFKKDQYYFDLDYRIQNKGSAALTFPDGSVIVSPSDFLGPVMEDYTNSYNQLNSVYYLDGDKENGSKGSGFFSSDNPAKGNVQWAGVMSRYFVALMIPQGTTTASAAIWDGDKASQGHRAGMIIPVEPLEKGQVAEKNFKVCVAEKKKDILVSVDPIIKDATDVNKWIQPIRSIVMICLTYIYKVLGNFGWAIIVFSIFTKLLFLPLTNKSTQSMKKMSALSPMLTELKAKYKDKPDVLQRKTMELYKEHGVNPLGGCLPLLVQMPFFIALYSALSNSLDMYQAPFLFWIKDLSLPDTVLKIDGYFNLNILPLIMVATTYLQQKFTTVDTGVGGQQQMMVKLMPVIFIFIFWRMPSGLIIYWIVQNLLQVGHQMYVNRKKS